jgi:hypothetical protein
MSYLDCAVLITTNFVQHSRAAYTATRTFTEWPSRNEFNGQTPLYLYSTSPESFFKHVVTLEPHYKRMATG